MRQARCHARYASWIWAVSTTRPRWPFRNRILETKTREVVDDCLILVEHPHVFTTGRREARAHILDPGGVPVHATSRGGDVTYHGPGQLVAYPIVDLESRLRRAVHRYLDKLEQVIIDVLGSFGLEGVRGGRRSPACGPATGRSAPSALP